MILDGNGVYVKKSKRKLNQKLMRPITIKFQDVRLIYNVNYVISTTTEQVKFKMKSSIIYTSNPKTKYLMLV